MFVNASAFVRVVSLHCFLALAIQTANGQEKTPPAEPKSLDELLGQSVTVNFDETPLADTITFLREKTGANIVVPPSALDIVMVDNDTPVTFELRDVPLRTVLKRILEPLELTYVQKHGVLLIVPQAEAPISTHVYEVGDLIYVRENERTVGYAHSLRELLIKVVAPNTWDENGGTASVKFAYPASFVVTQSPTGHRSIAQALKFLRLANKFRGSVPQTQIVIKEHSGAIERLEQALERQVKFNFDETPLVDVVSFLKDLTGLNILLDQDGLDIVMLDPDVPITLGLDGVRLADALELLLSDLELTAIIDNEVLVITDRQETAQKPILRLYLSGKQNCKEIITTSLFTDTWAENGGTGEAVYFAGCQCLAVLHNQEVHREIEKLIKSMQESSQEFIAASGKDGRPEMAEVQAAAQEESDAAISLEKLRKHEKQNAQMTHESETRQKLEKELFEAQVRKAKAEAELLERQLEADNNSTEAKK